MICDKSFCLKSVRLGGVIFLLILIAIRFYLGHNVAINQFLPDFFIRFFLVLRQKINSGLAKIIPEPQLSVMKSLFFGGKANLPFELKKQIRKVGLSHLTAVSGLHLTIVTQIISAFLNIFPLTGFLNFLFSLLFVLGFTIMADFSASVVRAAIMAILLLIARLNHRLYNSFFALVFAALLMVFLNPRIIIEDFGFQLSVLATLGIIYLYPVLEKRNFWQKDIFKNRFNFLKEALLLSFAAVVFVAPLIIYKTHLFSLVTPLTNLLIVPLVPAIMILGFLVALLSFICFPLALFLGFYLNILLSYMLKTITFFAQVPAAEILFPSFHWLWLIIYYLSLIYYLKCQKRRYLLRSS